MYITFVQFSWRCSRMCSSLEFVFCYLGLYISTVLSSNDTCFFPKQRSNTKLDLEVIKSFQPSGLQFCMQECIALKKCMSLNYDKYHFTCDLLNSDIETSPSAAVTKYGLAYIGINDILSGNNKVCGTVICEEYATCIRLSSGDHKCVLTECKEDPPTLQNGYIKERTRNPMVVTYSCNLGFTGIGTQHVISCVPGGVWSSLSYVCREPVNGNWGFWSGWSACSVDCGGGTKERIRSCNNPSPMYGGSDCHGESTESQNCNTDLCSGGWWGKR